jgi:hypothetical protein
MLHGQNHSECTLHLAGGMNHRRDVGLTCCRGDNRHRDGHSALPTWNSGRVRVSECYSILHPRSEASTRTRCKRGHSPVAITT